VQRNGATPMPIERKLSGSAENKQFGKVKYDLARGCFRVKGLGFQITMKGEKLQWRGKGPPDRVAPLLNILRSHKEEILNDPSF